MAEQKIRNAYKNFMFKFSPFLNANKNVGSIDIIDDKSVSDFSPKRFNFYSQVMESIVNSNPEIVKKVFNTVNLFKYKNDKMDKEIQNIRSRINETNEPKIVDMINKYLPEGSKVEASGNPSTSSKNNVNIQDIYGRIDSITNDLSNAVEQAAKAAVEAEAAAAAAKAEAAKAKAAAAEPENTGPTFKRIEALLLKVNESVNTICDNIGKNSKTLINKATLTLEIDDRKLYIDIESAKKQLSDLSKLVNGKEKYVISSERFSQKLYGNIFMYEIVKIFNYSLKNDDEKNKEIYRRIYEQLLLFFNNSSTFFINKHTESIPTAILASRTSSKAPFEKHLTELYSVKDLQTKTQKDITDYVSNFDTGTVAIRINILNCLFNAIMFHYFNETIKETVTSDGIKTSFTEFYKTDTDLIFYKTTTNISDKVSYISNLLGFTGDHKPNATQMWGGAPHPLQQVIDRYNNDPELSPNIDKVNLRDRGIFIVLTFIIRAISLFITEWAIYSGFINTFSQSFNMYFGVYICIFLLVLILTNSNNEDITFFNQLFYYVNTDSEDGKGLMRVLLQIGCIFFILPIPYMVKDFRLKDKTPKRVLTYTDKSNIYYSVDKFALYTWILTSIVALSV